MAMERNPKCGRDKRRPGEHRVHRGWSLRCFRFPGGEWPRHPPGSGRQRTDSSRPRLVHSWPRKRDGWSSGKGACGVISRDTRGGHAPPGPPCSFTERYPSCGAAFGWVGRRSASEAKPIISQRGDYPGVDGAFLSTSGAGRDTGDPVGTKPSVARPNIAPLSLAALGTNLRRAAGGSTCWVDVPTRPVARASPRESRPQCSARVTR